MLNRQKLYYDEYRILIETQDENGEKKLVGIKVTKAECFAPGEKPTKENPYKQRWYYSPDQKLAIRLPRNEEGERIYKKNEADLKGIERDRERQCQCVGQYDKTLCPVRCDNCHLKDSCRLQDWENNGYDCTRKCTDCPSRISMFRSMDKPIGTDDNGNSIMPDYASGEDVETAYIRWEEDREYFELVEEMKKSLDDDEMRLYKCFDNKMSVEDIMAEFNFETDYEFKQHKKALMEKFTLKWLRKNHEREAMVKGLVSTLSPDEQLLYHCIRNKMQVTKIAERFGVHRKTIEYRREKLRKKFIAAGLEEYF